jgi:anti-anti-sigma factor
MSARGPSGFYVQLGPSRTLLLRGELDIDTVQDLQDKIDKILAPGTPIILDLAQVSFLDSGAIHCFLKTWHATGHPVVLLNTSPAARRILDLATLEAEAWVFDGEGREMDGRLSTQEELSKHLIDDHAGEGLPDGNSEEASSA